MLGLTFSSKLDWDSYIVFITKTASKKVDSFYKVSFSWACFVSVQIYICLCMEYCCHVWAGTPSCYLELLDKLQKQICRTIGPSLVPLLNP